MPRTPASRPATRAAGAPPRFARRQSYNGRGFPALGRARCRPGGSRLLLAATSGGGPSIIEMSGVRVREIPLAQTRELRQAILRPHETLEELAAQEPESAFAVGAFDGAEQISVGFVTPAGEPGAWRVRGMATVAHARGHGAGTRVLDALVEHAIAQGATRVWCHARTPALSLYERAGFRAISEEFEIPPIGPHFVMELQIPSSAR